jgi:hypothetical protein
MTANPEFKKSENVFYYFEDNRANSYEIISIESGIKLINSHYIFGFGINGNLMKSYFGRFDIILAEYNGNRDIVKNIACVIENISKNGNFVIDRERPTRL